MKKVKELAYIVGVTFLMGCIAGAIIGTQF